MKYFKYSFLLLLPLCWYACEYETLKTFESHPDAYFTNLRDASAYNDSIAMNFFFLPVDLQDTTLTFSVTVTGKFSSVDRYVSVKANEQSTAVEGSYTMPASVKIPAGQISGTMDVVIHRTPDLGIPGPPKVLMLSLVANDDFGTNIKKELKQGTSNNETISVLDYKISFSDVISRPRSWSVDEYGVYSDKKFRLICLVNEVSPAYLDGEMVGGKTILPGENYSYALITQIYLNEQAAAGNTIYEEDGVTPMRMGDAVIN